MKIPRKIFRPISAAIATVSVAILIVAVWLLLPSNASVNGKTAGNGNGVPVEVARAREGVVVIDAETVGTLLANEWVMIRPEVTGRVDAFHFTEGQTVAKGAKLVTLDSAELKAQVAQSAAAEHLARLNHERIEELAGKRLVSQQAFDEAKARLVEAEARLKLDQARLEKTVLRAPFAGTLGVRRVSPGDYVAPGQDIINLESIDPLKVDLRLSEVYSRQIQPGQPITVRVDAFRDNSFVGEIYVVDPRLDSTTRSLLARARIVNPQHELRPGMFVTATIVLGRHERAVLIPEQALVLSGGDQFVYRVRDGKAAKIQVSVGNRRVGEVEITDGLAADDLVVTAGHQKLRDGAPVSPVDVPATDTALESQ